MIVLEQRHLVASATALYVLLSSTAVIAFQVGPPRTRSLRYVTATTPVFATWKDESPFLASRWRESYQDPNHALKRSLQQKSLLLRAVSEESTSSESSSSSSSASSTPSSPLSVTGEISGSVVRLLAQFVTTQLKSMIEERKRQELVKDASQQVEQLGATLHETQIAQEDVFPTWKAAGEAIQENNVLSDITSQENTISNDDNDHGHEFDVSLTPSSVTPSTNPTTTTISNAGFGIGPGTEQHFPGDVSNTRDVTLFDHFDTEESTATISSDKTTAIDDDTAAAVTTDDTLLPSNDLELVVDNDATTAAATTTTSVEDDAMTTNDHRAVLPRIPPEISLDFGKPLPVVEPDASGATQESSSVVPVDGVGTNVVSPPSMSLSSIMSEDDTSDVADVAPAMDEVSVIDENSVEDENVETQEVTLEGQTDHVAEEPGIDITNSKGNEELSELSQAPPPLTEEQLAAKYASITDLGEKAFAILLDLGLVQLSPDPDDPDYDHSQDNEFCPENVRIEPPPS